MKISTQGVEEIIIKESLEKKLKSGKKLRVKLGADPSRPDLHLGHTVVLRKLKEFQDLGHQVVFIIGDFTALIGDPSGKSKTRPALTQEEIKKNSQTYFKQVGKILDIKKTEIKYNSEWFSKFGFRDVLKLTSQFPIRRVLERDDFQKRLKSKADFYSHEILYPMMQAYDSLQIKADVEIGGTDQKFNMLAGRDLQRRLGLPEQDIITCPLLIGLDGREKMSKSLDNYVALNDQPNEIYGKLMSLPDKLIDHYFDLLTTIPRIQREKNPRQAKAQLAREIVGQYYSQNAVQQAEKEFNRLFKERQMPETIPMVKVGTPRRGVPTIVDLLLTVRLVPSKSEARRLIEQGGVKLNQRKITDWRAKIKVKNGDILQVGKRKFVRLKYYG